MLGFVLSWIYIQPKKSNQRITLWVWERPENLYFLDRENIDVAYLSASINLSEKGIEYVPRQQPLRVYSKQVVTSVIRINDFSNGKLATSSSIPEIKKGILKACQEKDTVSNCQIDFDATESQHNFYLELLREIRTDLPRTTQLSITALFSWCYGDDWLKDAPLDDIVPMYYRLGKDEKSVNSSLENGKIELFSYCSKSIGLADDEPWPPEKYLRNKEVYIFVNRAYTQDSWDNIMKRIETIDYEKP